MVQFYPSFESLLLADQILEDVDKRADGYQGRIGTKWYWRLPGGLLVTFWLDYTVTEHRWDVLHAEAASPNVGIFNAAEFPFAAYGTLLTSPPFIHELEGEAEWSNRLYFQMGYLIEDIVVWLEMLRASIIDPRIRPPATIPDISLLEQDLVTHAVTELDGRFILKKLHEEFQSRISYRQISSLAQNWEELGLLTKRPRRVTLALRSLVEAQLERAIKSEDDGSETTDE